MGKCKFRSTRQRRAYHATGGWRRPVKSRKGK